MFCRRLATDALLLAAALILAWLEAILPLGLPIFGFKLGLANIAVVLAVHLTSRRDALVVMLARVAVMSTLFGSVTSFAFSLAGGLFAFAVAAATKKIYGKISFVGVSILASAAHNVGQTLAACAVFVSPAPLGLLWWLLLLAIPTGALTGILAEIIYQRIKNIKI